MALNRAASPSEDSERQRAGLDLYEPPASPQQAPRWPERRNNETLSSICRTGLFTTMGFDFAREKWRPIGVKVRTSQPHEVQLVINITRKRGSSQIIFCEKPNPQDPPLDPIDRSNIVALALQLHAYLAADPSRFHDEVALKFGTSRPQVSQYLTLVDRLPASFINRMKACNDRKILRRFSGRTLIKISKLSSMSDRQQEIEHLLTGYKEQKVV